MLKTTLSAVGRHDTLKKLHACASVLNRRIKLHSLEAAPMNADHSLEVKPTGVQQHYASCNKTLNSGGNDESKQLRLLNPRGDESKVMC